MDGAIGLAPDLRETALWIGRGLVRREDTALLRGQGRFIADLRPQGCRHLVFLRAQHAGVPILSVNVAAARAMPGVQGVFTADDLRSAAGAPLGRAGVNDLVAELQPHSFDVLAAGRADCVGQPIAALVATTRAQAEDAAEHIMVALGAPDGTLCRGGYAQAWQRGDAVCPRPDGRAITVALRHARLAPMPMEPRTALAVWEHDRLTVWLGTQSPHRARDQLAEILGLAASQVRVVAPDIGGAFGGKASLYPEDVATAWAAWQLRAPVFWQGSRAEDLLAGTHGRGLHSRAVLHLDASGTMRSLAAEILAPLGHWMPFSAVVPGRNAGRILPGPYAVPDLHVALRGQAQGLAPMGIYRGAGRPEAAMLMETLVDAAARAGGEDPVAFRRRHLATPQPGEDTRDMAALLDHAVQLAGYTARRAALRGRRASGQVVGLGVALYLEPCGEGFEAADLRLCPDGSFVAATGATAQGQGRETAYAQILADALGVPPDAIVVRHGDTAATPPGIGALASRSTGIGGSALLRAAAALRARALPLAAELCALPPELVAFSPELWRRIAGCPGRWAVAERFTTTTEATSSGACIVALRIDRQTGVPEIEALTLVDDAGIVVNPKLLHGQLQGGIAQGLGEALCERIVYDTDGQLLSGSLMDYALPRAHDMPPLRLASLPTRSLANPLGARGVGEAGCIGVPAAVMNAALDALAPFGVTQLDLPLTSETLWRALHGRPARKDIA